MSGASIFLLGVLCAAALIYGISKLKAGPRLAPELKLKPAYPELWPLQRRAVVSRNEAIIWRWLRASFPNQRVLVKVPFSRFTSPTGKLHPSHFDVLNGLYTSFTIADRDGQVLGCIELSNSASRNTHTQLKQDILGQLGITYEVLNGADLPTAADFRAKVLARSDESQDSTFEEMLGDAKVQLQELLGRQRVRRHPESNDFRASDLHKFEDIDSHQSSWHTI